MACSQNSIFLWLVRWTLRHCGSRITFANTIAQIIMIFLMLMLQSRHTHGLILRNKRLAKLILKLKVTKKRINIKILFGPEIIETLFLAQHFDIN